jgi:Flp pilus assembly protein TadG
VTSRRQRPAPRPFPARLRGAGGCRGSATVELALIAPALLALFTMTVLAGRIVLAGGTVEQVAAAGARAASLARTPAAAASAADRAVRQTLDGQRLQCAAVTVTVDTSGFGIPLGQPAAVAVDVSCQVQLADLTAPGFPGTRTLSDRAVSPLDPYRGRTLGVGTPRPRNAQAGGSG